ncbi:MAG: ATP phosphoribosyltransferase [Ignavibacteriales bacterium]|nr:ATP phosphoribosyltransferase [Ignavibacteriales bacterium]
MLATNGRLKIALQKGGRLTEDSIALLRSCGLEFEFQKPALFSPCSNFPLDILSLRDDDIPEYVQDGVADLGIVGENIVQEKRARVKVAEKLGFGGCRLVVSVPQRSTIRNVSQLRRKRIATTYPRTLGHFLRSAQIKAEVIELSGAVELAPSLNVADSVCDIISTGTTSKVNGLRELQTILYSQAVLIANPKSLRQPRTQELIERLRIRISGSLVARGKRYVMLNAPMKSLTKLKKIIPALKSPTIVPLAEEGMVAVHSVIGENQFWGVMEKLKKAGASDIIVVPIETIIK